MKYFVIATKWDANHKEQERHIIGAFDSYINARLFKDAYDEHYRTESEIIDSFNLLND